MHFQSVLEQRAPTSPHLTSSKCPNDWKGRVLCIYIHSPFRLCDIFTHRWCEIMTSARSTFPPLFCNTFSKKGDCKSCKGYISNMRRMMFCSWYSLSVKMQQFKCVIHRQFTHNSLILNSHLDKRNLIFRNLILAFQRIVRYGRQCVH